MIWKFFSFSFSFFNIHISLIYSLKRSKQKNINININNTNTHTIELNWKNNEDEITVNADAEEELYTHTERERVRERFDIVSFNVLFYEKNNRLTNQPKGKERKEENKNFQWSSSVVVQFRSFYTTTRRKKSRSKSIRINIIIIIIQYINVVVEANNTFSYWASNKKNEMKWLQNTKILVVVVVSLDKNVNVWNRCCCCWLNEEIHIKKILLLLLLRIIHSLLSYVYIFELHWTTTTTNVWLYMSG